MVRLMGKRLASRQPLPASLLGRSAGAAPFATLPWNSQATCSLDPHILSGKKLVAPISTSKLPRAAFL